MILAYTILGADKMEKFEKMRIWLERKIDKIGDGLCMGAQEDIKVIYNINIALILLLVTSFWIIYYFVIFLLFLFLWFQ